MPGKTQVAIHKNKKHGHLKFADGTKSREFSEVAAGAMCFLIGVLEGRADPDELRSILSRLNSTELEKGSPVGTPIAVDIVVERFPTKPSKKPPGDPTMN